MLKQELDRIIKGETNETKWTGREKKMKQKEGRSLKGDLHER